MVTSHSRCARRELGNRVSWLVATVAALSLLGCSGVTAAPPNSATESLASLPISGRAAHIAILSPDRPHANSPSIKALVEGLRELGYREGENIHLSYGYSEGSDERAFELALEFVALKVDL